MFRDILYNINIYKISCNSISFHLNDIKLEKHLEKEVLKLNIFFENDKEIFITGKIIRSFSVDKKNYYELQYINTPDTVKDKIFMQLYKKQTQYERLISHE